MSDIHDSWQTIEDESPVRVRSTEPMPEANTEEPATISITHEDESPEDIIVPAASRKPAAIMGVVLTVSIGFLLVHGLGGILGQVANDPLTIRLTADGAVPPALSVHAGDTITWINDDTIPHILSAETLLDTEGMPLETTALFPQTSATTVIAPSTKPGTYAYISKTALHIAGQLIVEAGAAPVQTAPVTVSSAATSSFASSSFGTAVTENTNTQPPAQVTDTTVNNALPAYTASIPVNPHTVGSPDVPLPTRTDDDTFAPTTISTHTPRSNTETGPAVWITIVASMSLLMVVTRRHFKHA